VIGKLDTVGIFRIIIGNYVQKWIGKLQAIIYEQIVFGRFITQNEVFECKPYTTCKEIIKGDASKNSDREIMEGSSVTLDLSNNVTWN
jgi:hypothetical protein